MEYEPTKDEIQKALKEGIMHEIYTKAVEESKKAQAAFRKEESVKDLIKGILFVGGLLLATLEVTNLMMNVVLPLFRRIRKEK